MNFSSEFFNDFRQKSTIIARDHRNDNYRLVFLITFGSKKCLKNRWRLLGKIGGFDLISHVVVVLQVLQVGLQ